MKAFRATLILAFVVLLVLAGTEANGFAQGRPVPLTPITPGTLRVFIVFDDLPGPAEEALVRRLGGRINHTYWLVPAIAASIPAAALDGLLANPHVVDIEEDGVVYPIDHNTTPGDAELNNTWGVKHIGAGAVHVGGNKGTGVKVAVIDTGIASHTDLAPTGGYDFLRKDGVPDEEAACGGHGTHVSGTVAALDNDVGVVGVAPGAAIYALKVLGGDPCVGNWSDIIAALQWAVANGIQVTNNSYGSSVNPGSTVESAFNNSYAAGVLHVAAAGNSGNRKGTGNNVIYPARYNSVIAVAATEENDTRAWFSSTGDTVELAAPGVSINSTLIGGGYGLKSGTSMASPHVAGTAALVIAAGITDANGNGRINDEVRLRLQQTADDLGASGRDTWYGYGLVDADEAAGAPPPPPNNPPTVSITRPLDGSMFDSGATILFEGTASDTEDGDLTASLVWTSNINGQIGTGGSFSATLSDGIHTITASATDSGGVTGSASIGITVGTPPPEPTTVSVSSISYATEGGRNNDNHLLITVALSDNLGNPVAGASVSIRLDNITTGQAWVGTGTTVPNGTVTFTLRNAPSGCYTSTITDVTASGLTWDGVTLANGFCK